MDIRRAEEILNSKGIIQVTYKDSPVWIENIIKDGSAAQVTLLSNNETINIPVEELTER